MILWSLGLLCQPNKSLLNSYRPKLSWIKMIIIKLNISNVAHLFEKVGVLWSNIWIEVIILILCHRYIFEF